MIRQEWSILIVEDDVNIRRMMGELVTLKYPSAAVYLSSDGSMGIELFKKWLPDLVITDINMPKVNGLEMASRMRLLKSSTRFIAVSALSDERYHDQMAAVGLDEFISKPIELSKLFSAIDNCLSSLGSPPVMMMRRTV